MEQHMKWMAPALALGFGLLIGAFVLSGSEPIREQVVNTNPLMRGGDGASGQGGSFHKPLLRLVSGMS